MYLCHLMGSCQYINDYTSYSEWNVGGLISFIYVITLCKLSQNNGMLCRFWWVDIVYLRDYIIFPRTTECCAHCGRLGLKDELL